MNKTICKNNLSFDELSDEQLIHGVELLVSPDELTERDVLIAILKTLNFGAEEVVEQINEGVPLNSGATLCLSF